MLLDAITVLAPHIEHIVLVGAHAIYLHTEDVVTGVALFTKDADLALDPIGSCQDRELQSGSQSAPLRQTPQTRLNALDIQWPRAFILLLPAARLRS